MLRSRSASRGAHPHLKRIILLLELWVSVLQTRVVLRQSGPARGI